uniref:F-box domain-containing protein n=1 Tax=Solanum lycopersicum TaxID=4081 RepID=K4BW72_SOLLC
MSEVTGNARKSITIGDLPNCILHTILEFVPIQDAAKTSVLSKKWMHIWSTLPHIVLDHLFFHYVSKSGASASSIISKILLQHTGVIMGLHLISSTCKLAQSDVDQCIIFVLEHGIQKLTLDMANDENYLLPDKIFTCATLTHLKLSRCFFELLDGTQFPNLISLKLEHSKIAGHRGLEINLYLPMLETLELRFCVDVDSVYLVCPKLDNMSIVSSYTVTFRCFNRNPIFARIKHLCLDGSSLKNLGSLSVPDMLDVSLNLQSLRICDIKISIKRISCALCLLRNSPNLVELDIDEVVKVNETICYADELLDYLSEAVNEVSKALRMIRTVRLRKFKGTSTEMYLIKVLLAHSPKLERMIIEQYKRSNVTYSYQHLNELLSYCRASPNAEIKYT